jgi:hypothetical protein
MFLVIVLVTVVAVSPGPMLFTLVLTYVISGPLEYLLKRYRAAHSTTAADSPAPIGYENTTQDDASHS